MSNSRSPTCSGENQPPHRRSVSKARGRRDTGATSKSTPVLVCTAPRHEDTLPYAVAASASPVSVRCETLRQLRGRSRREHGPYATRGGRREMGDSHSCEQVRGRAGCVSIRADCLFRRASGRALDSHCTARRRKTSGWSRPRYDLSTALSAHLHEKGKSSRENPLVPHARTHLESPRASGRAKTPEGSWQRMMGASAARIDTDGPGTATRLAVGAPVREGEYCRRFSVSVGPDC